MRMSRMDGKKTHTHMLRGKIWSVSVAVLYQKLQDVKSGLWLQE